MTFIAIAFLLLMLFAFVMLALSPPERVSWRRRRLGEDSHDDFSGGLFPDAMTRIMVIMATTAAVMMAVVVGLGIRVGIEQRARCAR